MRTHYEILGLSAAATLDDIRGAYRRLSKENHPDAVDPSQNPEEWRRRNAIAVQLNEAYRVLRSEELRKRYDESLKERFRPRTGRGHSTSEGNDHFGRSGHHRAPRPHAERSPAGTRAPANPAPPPAKRRVFRRKIDSLEPDLRRRMRDLQANAGPGIVVAPLRRSFKRALIPIVLIWIGALVTSTSPKSLPAFKPWFLEYAGLAIVAYGMLGLLRLVSRAVLPPLRPSIVISRTRLILVDHREIIAWPLEELGKGGVRIEFRPGGGPLVAVNACGLTKSCAIRSDDLVERLRVTLQGNRAACERAWHVGIPMSIFEQDEFAGFDHVP